MQMLQTSAAKQMGAGIAAGPHCRRCWHPGFPAPELTASFRRSLPFGFRPFGWSPRVRLAVRLLLLGRIFHSARLSVLRRPQFLTAWAWQSLAPVASTFALPRSLLLRACFLALLRAPLPQVQPCGFAFGRFLPQGEKGPSARSGVLPLAPLLPVGAPGLATIGLAASASLRDANPASGTGHSGLRVRHFQSAPQHAESGFNAYFPVRPDWSTSAFRSVPCGSFLQLRFPLDKTDAAPRP